MKNEYYCSVCDEELNINQVFHFEGVRYCRDHFIEANNKVDSSVKDLLTDDLGEFNPVQKPKHYHTYDMDTLEFLEYGFPPRILKGFCTGSVIKYTQRYELKNGLEDLEKAKFYLEKLIELSKKDF